MEQDSKMQKINEFPPFSVLLSVYVKENATFLDKALDSIEKQTVLPKEIILVKDGKLTKKLENVIKKHKNHDNINYVIVALSKNKGLAQALKYGTSYVTTNWIARMDSDDYSVPDRFEKQLNAIVKNPSLAIVGGQVAEFSGNITNITGYRRVPLKKDLIYDFLKWRNPFNHPTVMINKTSLNSVGGYQSFGNLEDYYLWSRMVANKLPMVNLDDVLTYMRVDDGMYSRRGKLSNIKYFYRLRQFLYKNNVLTWQEKIFGDWIMTLNIIMPGWIRRIIYQHVLHK